MFDDLFGETYRADSPSKKKKAQQQQNYLQTGTYITLDDYHEVLDRNRQNDNYQEIQVKLVSKPP